MIRILTCIGLAAGALLICPAPAQAAESYDNCTGFINSLPATINSQGVWCLNNHLSTAMTSGSAITVATNNVTIDCNDFKLGGLAAGPGTTTYGIRADNRFNTTIRNCNIRGFYIGAYLTNGGSQVVKDNTFDGNTLYGVYVSSPGSVIRGNLVVDTGGSTASTGTAAGINAVDGVDIIDNTVNGVVPTGADATAYGIQTNFNGDGSVTGNRVRGLVAAGVGTPRGIYNLNSGRTIVRDNDVQGPGPGVVGGVGIRCISNLGTARDNVIAGFETGVESCFSSSNTTNGN